MLLRLALLAAVALPAQQIPKAWDDAALAAIELPLVHANAAPKTIPAAEYYKLPVRPLWKSYPVYHPDQAPPNYIEWLRSQDPQKMWDPSDLKSETDWIRAGEDIFEAPVLIEPLGHRPPTDPPFISDKTWFDKVKPPVGRDGAITGLRYVIRIKGKIEIGSYSCAGCHNRVLRNGFVVKGGPGNFPIDEALSEDFLASASKPDLRAANKALFKRLFEAPWFTGERASVFNDAFSIVIVSKLLAGRTADTMTPYRSTPWHPVQVPDITGVKDRRYLDHTGLFQNDLLRYVALKQHAYDPKSRASDDQLYALTKYLESLNTPKSPIKPDKITNLGEKVYEREGCGQCHSGGQKLTPVQGFEVPEEHKKKYDINSTVVGTNPGLALDTLRGTGYYKAPSLKGLWYRGQLEHTGAVATLEEWLDPSRLQYNKGHEFGLRLSGPDRFALIAYLRTL